MSIVLGILIVILLIIAGIVVTIIDAIRWRPWAHKHGYRSGVHVDVTDWGFPFGTDAVLKYAAFHGSLGDKPMNVVRYRNKLNPTDNERHDAQVCAIDLGRPVGGRMHLRRRDISDGPLAQFRDPYPEPTGDQWFDARFETSGDTALWQAVLTPDVKHLLMGADVAGVRLAGQWLVVIGRHTKERRRNHDLLISVADGLLARLPRTISPRVNWAA